MDDEVVAEHLTQECVIGSVYNIADVCTHTGDCAIEVNWSIDPYFFSLAGNEFGGMVPVWEHEVLAVKFRTDEDDGSKKLVTRYFENINSIVEMFLLIVSAVIKNYLFFGKLKIFISLF